jgi:CheY-like chemotaxis protein
VAHPHYDPAVSSEESSPTTLLVVDDEPQLLRLMVRVLERGRFRVLAAENGDEAMALLVAHQHDIGLVILDVILPPDGVGALLDRLHERHVDVPLVLTSGDNLEGSLRRRLDACGGVFLRKPFLPKLLLRTVQERLSAEAGATARAAERG